MTIHQLRNLGNVDGEPWYLMVEAETWSTTEIAALQVDGRMASQACKWIWNHVSDTHFKLGTGNEFWVGDNNAVRFTRSSNHFELFVWATTDYLEVNSAQTSQLLARIGRVFVLTESTSHPAVAGSQGAIYCYDTGSGDARPYAADEDNNVNPLVPWKQSITLALSATSFTADAPLMDITPDGGGNIIGSIDGEMAFAGQETTIIARGNMTMTNNDTATANTMSLGSTFAMTNRDTLTLKHDGTKWYEKCRSVN